jgi:hypothetical protein
LKKRVLLEVVVLGEILVPTTNILTLPETREDLRQKTRCQN